MERGDPQAKEDLLPLVYEELRNLAAAKMSQQRPACSTECPKLRNPKQVKG
jgi:hypothetical protein